jgi:hypothetical protein
MTLIRIDRKIAWYFPQIFHDVTLTAFSTESLEILCRRGGQGDTVSV